MSKKILFISDHGDPLAPLGSEQAGGQNNYVKQLALALEKRGHSVDVITHWTNPNDKQIEPFGNYSRVIRIAAGRKMFVSKNDMFPLLPTFYQELKNLIPLPTYNLIHTHYWLSGMLGSFIKKDYNIPWVHTNHSLGIVKKQVTKMYEPTRLAAETYLLKSADIILATTRNEKEIIRKFVYHPAPIAVIPIGVDKVFRPIFEKRKQKPSYFAYAGRLEETKGIYTLIQSFRLLMEQEKVPTSTKLIIAGGDTNDIDMMNKIPKITKLKRAVRGLEHQIEFIGSQSQQNLAKLFNHAVATVVPSYYESFGMVAAEAQACGCPVIASNVGGLKEVVKDRVTGLHTKKGDAIKLAQIMKAFLLNSKYTNQLGRKAAAHAKLHFNWNILANKIDHLYEMVLEEALNNNYYKPIILS